MRRRRTCASLLLGLGLTVGALGCDTPAPTVPAPPPRLVVHGVLDPRAVTQVVMLQESRAFRSPLPSGTYDPNDPIVTWGEIPVSNARVVLYAANGDSAVGAEDHTLSPGGKGAGVYRFWSSSIVAPPASAAGAFMPIHQGERYRLRITSKFGVAQGTTLVPRSNRSLESDDRFLQFDLTRDTLRMRAAQVSAAGYLYRDEMGQELITFNDRYRRDLERQLILPSANDDWAFAFERELFTVGSSHVLSVTAVDSNFFDYYATAFDPFESRSDQTALTGAAGLFGSVLQLYVIGVDIRRRP